MSWKAPCDVILDAIENDEARSLAKGLHIYVINTRGGVPRDAARWLASQTLAELKARTIGMERHLAIERGEAVRDDR